MNGGDTKSHCQERDQERDTSFVHSPFLSLTFLLKASVVMQRLPYPTETVLSNKITRNRIFLSFKDSPRKPLRRRPSVLPRQWRKGDKMYRARERERERGLLHQRSHSASAAIRREMFLLRTNLQKVAVPSLFET